MRVCHCRRIAVCLLLMLLVAGCTGDRETNGSVTEEDPEDEEDLFSEMTLSEFKDRYRRLVPYIGYYVGNYLPPVKPEPEPERKFVPSVQYDPRRIGADSEHFTPLASQVQSVSRYNTGGPQDEERLEESRYQALTARLPEVHGQQSLVLAEKPAVNLDRVLEGLQLSEKLPETLNRANIDDSLRTLVDILSLLYDSNGRRQQPQAQRIEEKRYRVKTRPKVVTESRFQATPRPVYFTEDPERFEGTGLQGYGAEQTYQDRYRQGQKTPERFGPQGFKEIRPTGYSQNLGPEYGSPSLKTYSQKTQGLYEVFTPTLKQSNIEYSKPTAPNGYNQSPVLDFGQATKTITVGYGQNFPTNLNGYSQNYQQPSAGYNSYNNNNNAGVVYSVVRSQSPGVKYVNKNSKNPSLNVNSYQRVNPAVIYTFPGNPPRGQVLTAVRKPTGNSNLVQNLGPILSSQNLASLNQNQNKNLSPGYNTNYGPALIFGQAQKVQQQQQGPHFTQTYQIVEQQQQQHQQQYNPSPDYGPTGQNFEPNPSQDFAQGPETTQSQTLNRPSENSHEIYFNPIEKPAKNHRPGPEFSQRPQIPKEEGFRPTIRPETTTASTTSAYQAAEDFGTGHQTKYQTRPGANQLPGVPTIKYGATRGKPNVDYPAYASIPETDFSCKDQRYKGFFGDPSTGCQVWHYCDLNGGKASFLCPNGTIFSQVALTCDWWFNVKCETTRQLYVLNERLYKYILPIMPKFPEDFTGPEVDRYLEIKFKEMEAKLKEKKMKKLEKERKEKEKKEKNIKTSGEEQ